MSFHLFVLLFFRSGAPLITLLTAGAFTDIQLPATASVRLMQGWVASAGCPPQQKILVAPVLLFELNICLKLVIVLLDTVVRRTFISFKDRDVFV